MLAVGIIGDFNPKSETHMATNQALQHASNALSIKITSSWIPTVELNQGSSKDTLSSFDAIWAAPGSPYASMEGALQGIRFAREYGWPFFGT